MWTLSSVPIWETGANDIIIILRIKLNFVKHLRIKISEKV